MTFQFLSLPYWNRIAWLKDQIREKDDQIEEMTLHHLKVCRALQKEIETLRAYNAETAKLMREYEEGLIKLAFKIKMLEKIKK